MKILGDFLLFPCFLLSFKRLSYPFEFFFYFKLIKHNVIKCKNKILFFFILLFILKKWKNKKLKNKKKSQNKIPFNMNLK